MKNFKKNFIFCTIIVFSIENCSYGHDAAGVKMAQEFNKGVNNLSDSIKTELPNAGLNSATKLSDAITTSAVLACGTAVAYGLGYATYYVYKEVKSGVKATANFCFPSTEEKLHKKELSTKLQILNAKEELYQSLAAHAKEEKNSRGIPCACEEAANKYATVAGIAALGEIEEEFRREYCNKTTLAAYAS